MATIPEITATVKTEKPKSKWNKALNKIHRYLMIVLRLIILIYAGIPLLFSKAILYLLGSQSKGNSNAISRRIQFKTLVGWGTTTMSRSGSPSSISKALRGIVKRALSQVSLI